MTLAAVAARAQASPAVAPRSASAASESALDALAALRDAEARTYRLPADGVMRFSCRISSPYVAKLWESGGPLEGNPQVFTLWWISPSSSRVIADGEKAVEPVLLASILALFRAVPEAFLAPPASASLRGKTVTFGVGGPGEVVVEATARSAADDVELARYTIGSDGLVRREQVRRRDGGASDLRFEHERVAGRTVVTRSHGSWRGVEVDLRLTWSPSVSGRPVPTHLVVTQRDAASGLQLPGALGEMIYELSDHVINGDLPAGTFDEDGFDPTP